MAGPDALLDKAHVAERAQELPSPVAIVGEPRQHPDATRATFRDAGRCLAGF
jgi:hypothetical protein